MFHLQLINKCAYLKFNYFLKPMLFIINLYYCLLLFMRHLVKINGNVLNLLPISKVKAKTELLLILIYLNNFVS